MTINAAMHDWLDGGINAKILGLANHEISVQKFIELESQKQQKYEQLFRLPVVAEYARTAPVLSWLRCTQGVGQKKHETNRQHQRPAGR
jgi:hypothetical protein